MRNGAMLRTPPLYRSAASLLTWASCFQLCRAMQGKLIVKNNIEDKHGKYNR
jgi:hypothetical protein